MTHVSFDDVDREPLETGVDCVRLTDSLETASVSLNHYHVAPGEGLPGGVHAHWDQEEVFLVVDGEATFETVDGEVTVASGEVVRFAPTTFHSGRNAADDPLVVLAVGAPRETSDIRIPFACPNCAESTLRLDTAGHITFECPSCGADHLPKPCPECGSDGLQVTLDETGTPVVDCPDCAATFESPPL